MQAVVLVPLIMYHHQHNKIGDTLQIHHIQVQVREESLLEILVVIIRHQDLRHQEVEVVTRRAVMPVMEVQEVPQALAVVTVKQVEHTVVDLVGQLRQVIFHQYQRLKILRTQQMFPVII